MTQATTAHMELCQAVSRALGSWRRFVIAIDGRDGAGKSTTGRYLAWQTGMSVIETDLFKAKRGDRVYRKGDLKRAISKRLDHHSGGRPVIVEGVFVVDLLDEMGISADFVVRVSQTGIKGCSAWQIDYEDYERRHENVHFAFKID